MEGICVASARNREKPASETSATGIHTKVRYRETGHATFTKDVGGAWQTFIETNYAQSEMWAACYTQTGYDSERELKQIASYHDNHPASRRVFFPDFGVAETPEEKEAAEKMGDVRDKIASLKSQVEAMKVNREVERMERERAAAEAERQRIAAEEKRKVDAIAQQIGPGKDAAAARLAAMNEELKALRPKASARQCTTRSFTQPMSSSSPNQSNAYDSLMAAIARRSGANIGGSESVVSMTASGNPSCAKEKVMAIVWQPPVGECLSCVTEAQAKMLGWVPGSGWPPPKTEFVCKVSVQVVAEKCSSGASTVTSQ